MKRCHKGMEAAAVYNVPGCDAVGATLAKIEEVLRQSMHSMTMRGGAPGGGGCAWVHAPLLGLVHPHGAYAPMRSCALSVMRLVHCYELQAMPSGSAISSVKWGLCLEDRLNEMLRHMRSQQAYTQGMLRAQQEVQERRLLRAQAWVSSPACNRKPATQSKQCLAYRQAFCWSCPWHCS